jgi:mRNA-degrading endonuclease HigB of HigAB toxin-antitoxin module
VNVDDLMASQILVWPNCVNWQRGIFRGDGLAGNKYRLIAAIHYNRHKVFIRAVLTHAEYDRGDWKRRK